MKQLILIGGTAPASTADYYVMLDQMVKQKLGGNHSLRCTIENLEFSEIESLISAGDIDRLYRVYADILSHYKENKICYAVLSNTIEVLIGDELQNAFRMAHQISIREAIRRKILQRKLSRIALLGTSVTMNDCQLRDFYQEKGIQIFVPESNGQTWLNDLIFNRLTQGEAVTPEMQSELISLLDYLHKLRDIDGFILGCTELQKVISADYYNEKSQDYFKNPCTAMQAAKLSVPMRFDSTEIHCEAIVDHYLNVNHIPTLLSVRTSKDS